MPLAHAHPWPPVLDNWATKIVDRLNAAVLGEHFVARLGSSFSTNGHGGGVATAPAVFAPPAPLSAAAAFAEPDLFEVKVYRGTSGWHLVAAIELVSEANKDRPDARRALAVKTASYLQQGVSVVVVDPVTTYTAAPHADLCDLLALPPALRWESPTGLAAVAYRADRPDPAATARLDVWPYPLAVGAALPTVPLWLAPDLAVPLELELTYAAALRSLRIR